MENINKALNEVKDLIRNVENEIVAVGNQITDVEAQIVPIEASFAACTDLREKDDLRDKVKYLRTKEGQLRTKEVQLRTKEEQLRTKEEQLRQQQPAAIATVARLPTTVRSSSSDSCSLLKNIRNNNSSLLSVELLSPTAKGTNHLITKGFAAFVRTPLSLPSPPTSTPMAVTDSDIQFLEHIEGDTHMGRLALSESSYYMGAIRFLLRSVLSGCPGDGRTAGSLYRNAFHRQRSHITLPSGCRPEFATTVSQSGMPTQNGELKSIESDAVEEQALYSAIAMTQSYFPCGTGITDYEIFYDCPPVSIQVVGWGPMAMLFASEFIGCIYYSIVSKPFFLESSDHKSAIKMADTLVQNRRSIPDLQLDSDTIMYSNHSKPFVSWAFIDNGATFCKVIRAGLCATTQTSSSSTTSFHKKEAGEYAAIVDEAACMSAGWSHSHTISFYHTWKVMQVWQKVWEVVYSEENASYHYRSVFVNTRLLYGHFSVCLLSPCVGTRDATVEESRSTEFIKPLVQAMYWLAHEWQLLYIDFRSPNIRVTLNTDGTTIHRVHLIDYDDLVILKEKPCCDRKVFNSMCHNQHMNALFENNQELFLACKECCINLCSQCLSNGDDLPNVQDMTL